MWAVKKEVDDTMEAIRDLFKRYKHFKPRNTAESNEECMLISKQLHNSFEVIECYLMEIEQAQIQENDVKTFLASHRKTLQMIKNGVNPPNKQQLLEEKAQRKSFFGLSSPFPVATRLSSKSDNGTSTNRMNSGDVNMNIGNRRTSFSSDDLPQLNQVQQQMQRRTEIIKNQDEMLDSLGETVAKLHQIGLAINTELVSQNKILDNMTVKVDEANYHLTHNNKSIAKLLK